MASQMNFQRSANTRFVAQKLRSVSVGTLVPYDALAAEAGVSAMALSSAIQSARRILLHEESIVFGVVRGVGLRRLDDHQIVATSAATAQKVRRAARRGVRVLTAVQNFSALSREDQMRHSAGVSVLAAISEMTSGRSIAKIEAVAAVNGRELPFAQTLAAFQSAPK